MNFLVNRFWLWGICTIIALPLQAIAADKAIIGIGEITSSIQGADPVSFQTMLETQLIKTNKFTIIERSRLEQVLSEQGLSESGLIDGGHEFGNILGVDYLIYGSITKLGRAGSRVSVGRFATGSNHYEMAVDLRIIDVQTGEIRLAETVEKYVKGASSLRIKGFSQQNNGGDPIADVQRLAAMSVTGLIVTTLYPAKIVAVQNDGSVVVNYGDSIFTIGDFVAVYEVGEGFTDPDTGEILGAEETQVAMLEIYDVKSKYSKARRISGREVKRGDIVRRVDTEQAKASKKKRRKKKKI